MRTLLTIGEVAKLLHLSPSQIRFYEKKGLLAPHHKDSNGYRLYSYDEIDTLEYIATFRNIGVSIPEIKEFIHQKNDDDLINVLNSTTDQLQLEIDKLTSQVDMLNDFKKQFSLNLSTSSQIVHYPERLLYIIDEDMSIEKQEKDVYDFVSKYNIDYRYHEQQFLTLLIDQTQKLCLFSKDKNIGLNSLETYTLEEGNYFTCNTETTSYSELNTAYAFVSQQCKQAGYTPVGPGITIEDTTTLLLSKSTVRLTAQIKIKD